MEELLAIVSSLDEVPDGVRSVYRQGDPNKGESNSNYYLRVKGVDGFALENVTGLKTALSSERTARETAERAARAFEGLDADDTRKQLAQLEKLRDSSSDEKVMAKIEAQVKQVREKYEADLAKAGDDQKSMATQIEELLVNATARTALGQQKLVEGGADLLMPHIRGQVKVDRDDNGRFVARVVNPDGSPRISMKQGSTDNMDIGELVESMRDSKVFAPAFAGSGATGSGANGGVGDRGTGANFADIKDPGERMKSFRRAT